MSTEKEETPGFRLLRRRRVAFEFQTEEVLSQIQKFMEILGFWPEQEPYGTRVLLNSFVSFVLYIVPQLIYVARSENFLHSCEGLCEMIGICMFNLQLHMNARNNLKLRGLVRKLRKFWRKTLTSDIPAWKKYDLEFQDKLSLFTKFVTYAFMLQGVFYVIGTELALLLLKFLGFDVNTFSYGMHLNFYFDVFHTDWRFFLPVFIIDAVYLPIFVVSYLLTGFFGAQLIIALSGCFEYVGMELRSFSRSSRTDGDGALKAIVKNHVEAIEMANELDDCLNVIFMVKFFFNILFMCLMMFTLLIDFDFAIFIKLFVFFLMVFTENSGFFFIADHLSEKAADISFIAYDLDWYDHSKPVKLTLLMIIAQSQKPVALTAGRFYDVTVHKYSQHLQAAYNCYNVLREILSS